MEITNPVLGLGVLLLIGFIGGRIVKILKLPAVTGYLIAGLILGPSITGLIPNSLNTELDFVKVLGLGLIALIIGGELNLQKLRKFGRSITIITISQVSGAFIVTFLIMRYVLNISLPLALLFAGLETATAPASPVAVIKEYKASGILSQTILAVVGLDDAICISIVSVVMAIVAVILSGINSISFDILTIPFLKIFGSILSGIIIGFLFVNFCKKVNDRHQVVTILLGIALFFSGLADIFGFSELILTMVIGMVIINYHHKPEIIYYLEDIELPIFVIFFTLAGASLRLDLLAANWIIVFALIMARIFGKVGGAFFGAGISNADTKVQKYLGFAMFSKAGVTIGLVLLVMGKFPEFGSLILAVELGTVVFCELLGPIGTRYALMASGEVQEI